MSLIYDLKIKITTVLLILFYTSAAIADPEINGELLPPGEATHVTDPEVLKRLNLGPDTEPVWCYSDLANGLIITSAQREREKCALRLEQETKKLTLKYNLKINTLQLQIDSLIARNQEIINIKDQEINKLTVAAQQVPNNNIFGGPVLHFLPASQQQWESF